MKKVIVYFFAMISIFTTTLAIAPKAAAWSDDVEGVLMPEARGGGGISDQDAEREMSGSIEDTASEPQALIEWE
jgi:hypothetical protein